MMTKAEMEAIWNSKEIGLLAKAGKKKHRMRRLKVTFFREVEVSSIEELVLTSNKDPNPSNYSWAAIHRHYKDSKEFPSNKYRAQWMD